jgi:hypothetical protein
MSTEQPAATPTAAAPAAGAPSAPGASPSPEAGAPADGAESLETMLSVVHTAAEAVLIMGTRSEIQARLSNVLKSVYDLLGDGQRAIMEVQADIAAGRPVTVPPAVVPALPDWPTDPSAAPSLMQDVWSLVQPWASRLVVALPGQTPGEEALKAWAASVMSNWQVLSADIENVVNGSRAG